MKAKITASALPQFQPRDTVYEVLDTELPGFCLRVEPGGARSYYYVYRDRAGHKKRIRFGRAADMPAAEARRRAQTLAGEVAAGVDVQKHKKMQRDIERQRHLKVLGHFIEEEYGPWLIDQTKRGKETVRRLTIRFKFLFDKPMDEIQPMEIERWRQQRQQAGIGRNTINRDFMALRGCLTKAMEWGLIAINPVARVKAYKTERCHRIRYLSEDEEARLLQALDAREQELREARARHNEHLRQRSYALFPDLHNQHFADFLKPMVLLAMHTGMRKGEIFSLEWQDVNLTQCFLLVRAEKAKTSEQRYIPLNADIVATLRLWRAQHPGNGYVFQGRDGRPFRDIKKSWYRVLELAGIADFRWHDLRHHFASRLAMASVELNTIRELLGHKEMTMTLRYAHLSPDHKHDAVAKLAGHRYAGNVSPLRRR